MKRFKVLYYRMIKAYELAVWDSKGRQYLPVYEYNGDISHYARAEEAIAIFNLDVMRTLK